MADERSFKQLQTWGIDNSFLVRPGINIARFSHTPCPLHSEIKLMVGSAPWTKAQFRSKGIDALLEAAQQAPHLRLIFLWRGVLGEEMNRRIQKMNLEKQVTVLDKFVDVNAILADVHASITLADAPGLVKSYPHSLLDSLAAGKPVLISQAIPMADYVAETGCGQVIDRVTPTDILIAVEALASKYEARQKIARRVGRRDFSQQALVTSYQRVYEQVLDTFNQTK
ncbi:MAG: glycosyltransferase [Phycisphaerae bacterium]|nr:glycosyltransferase [Phycisphaerae bacterium]